MKKLSLAAVVALVLAACGDGDEPQTLGEARSEAGFPPADQVLGDDTSLEDDGVDPEDDGLVVTQTWGGYAAYGKPVECNFMPAGAEPYLLDVDPQCWYVDDGEPVESYARYNCGDVFFGRAGDAEAPHVIGGWLLPLGISGTAAAEDTMRDYGLCGY